MVSELVFVIGGGIFGLVGGASLFRPLLLSLRDKPFEASTVLILVFFVMSVLWLGMLSGVVLWILVMRSFLTRDEIEQSLTKPHVPLISNLLQKIFNVVYKR